jgi:hypothetical protein
MVDEAPLCSEDTGPPLILGEKRANLEEYVGEYS